MSEREKIEITAKCPWCEEVTIVEVYKEDHDKWQRGALIQNAMPYLSATEREALMTGICDTCWDMTFKE